MNYRFILWDFDGTIADSLAVAMEVFNRLAPVYDFLPVTDVERVRQMTVKRFLKEHHIGLLKLPKITRAFQKEIRERIATVRLFPGIAATLRQLRLSGVRHGVLSSNTPENILLCLRANGIADQFDFTAGCFKLLGKARGIKQAIRQSGLKKIEVLYVGDEVRDIVAARKAGVDVAAVCWGMNDPATLVRQKPTHLLAEPEELVQMLDTSVDGGGTRPSLAG
jgi:phosphoglycolate phosphatase